MRVKNTLFVALGCLCTGLGAVGAVLPLLPTVPFLMLAAYCFARSSQRLHNWFTGTKLYRDNLESYIQGRGMTKKAKLRIMTTMTILMAAGFILMRAVPVGRIALAAVWAIHAIYFLFGVKTIPAP